LPTYVATCESCGERIDYFRKVDDRDNTPDHCGQKTVRVLVAPMVQAMTITQGIKAGDGRTYYGKSEYDAYCKKAGVLPASELKGEAAYRRKVIEADHKAEIRKTVEQVVASTG
jgi:hypothetical protein